MRKRRRKNITKANSLLRHSKRRASERYGLNIGRAGLWEIVNIIRSGRAIFVRKETNRVSEWKVEYSGVSMRVIYDRRRKMVVTFLPPDDLGAMGEDSLDLEEMLPTTAECEFWEREAALAFEV